MNKKPIARIIGADGNVFNTIGIARRALKDAKMFDEATEFVARAMKCSSYDEVLTLLSEYVEPRPVTYKYDEHEDEDEDDWFEEEE